MQSVRLFGFPALCFILSLLYFDSLQALVTLALKNDAYTHTLLMPFAALFFIFIDRKAVPLSQKLSLLQPLFAIIPGIVLLAVVQNGLLAEHTMVAMDCMLASYISFLIGGMIFFYGIPAFVKTRFSWFLMLLAIPVPMVVLNYIVTFFRDGSAEVVNVMLQITGITFIREGLTFRLPSITIFIAPECSGIRSSIALFITALFAGQLYLKTVPAKLVLLLCVIPLTLLKNGLRITTLTILADKVDVAWITHSRLHHEGGIVFFAIILLLLFGILFILQRAEKVVLSRLQKKQADLSGHV